MYVYVDLLNHYKHIKKKKKKRQNLTSFFFGIYCGCLNTQHHVDKNNLKKGKGAS